MTDQTKVRVCFDYYPEQPDPDDPTGMSEEEHVDLMDKLMALGADEIEAKRVTP